VAIGAVTDPYQPAEGRFAVTRQVLEAVARLPGLRVGITSKSAAITRDLDLLTTIAAQSDLIVNVSLASMDAALLRRVEPRAPRPDLRLEAMARLSASGVPVRLFAMPLLPFLTDGENALRTLFPPAPAPGGAGGDVERAVASRGDPRLLHGLHPRRVSPAGAALPEALPRRRLGGWRISRAHRRARAAADRGDRLSRAHAIGPDGRGAAGPTPAATARTVAGRRARAPVRPRSPGRARSAR